MGKKKNLIDYSTGVKQGDNLDPVLYVIVMQFLAELSKKNGERTTLQTKY